jgi:hypothetical protein
MANYNQMRIDAYFKFKDRQSANMPTGKKLTPEIPSMRYVHLRPPTYADMKDLCGDMREVFDEDT